MGFARYSSKPVSQFIASILLAGSLGILLSCTKKVDYQDLRSTDIDFSSFNKQTFTNQNDFGFNMNLKLSGHFSPAQVTLAVYESEDCTGEFVEQPQGSLSFVGATGLQDGKKYSFHVLIVSDEKTYRSPCTPWVGVDQQPPNQVTPVVPPTDMYTTEAKVRAQWNPTTDNGISGLTEKPYRIKLFDQAACAGTIIQTIDTDSVLEEFAGMLNGNFYSYQVLALDNAGNESPVSCSPQTEIDLYAPGLTLTDPGSDVGFSDSVAVNVTIVNDTWAGYWCLTTDASFSPLAETDACPGGQGGTNGWHTSRPITYNLMGADGLKNVYLWLLNGDGDRRTDRHPLFPITLDTAAPGPFTIGGVTGEDDAILNDYLSDNVDPVVHWTTPVDANLEDFIVQILNPDTSVRCQTTANFVDTSATVENCNLQEGDSYIVRVIAGDNAGHTTTAPDMPIMVDLTPPGNFVITGVRGTTDSITDVWSPGVPNVYWNTSTDAERYFVLVRDQATTLPMCGEETVTAPLLNFDFNAVACSPFSDGSTYEVLIRSQDDAGLYTSATNQPFAFRADMSPPGITITGEPNALDNETSVDYDFTVVDPLSGVASIDCQLNGGGYSACTSPKNYNGLTHGSYLFELRARDNVGNEFIESDSFEVDLNPPVVNITSGPATYVSATSASIQFTAVDSGSSGVANRECRLDAGSWAACTSPYNENSLSDGPHSVFVRATDNLGHVSSIDQHDWTVDTSAPVVNITGGPTDGTTSTVASVTFTAVDLGSPVTSSECRWDAGAWAVCSSPASTSGLSVGLHNFYVRATNQAGLTSAPQTYTWNIYSYSWQVNGWAGCNAAQPSWQAGGWGGCSVGQPAYSYDGWGGCSASCGGGTQWRNQSCPVVWGSQSRSVWCPVNGGTEFRSVWCQRAPDSAVVADGFCGGGKPGASQACSRNDCPGGAPAASQSCSRGGGGDCHSAQATSQSCNTHACLNCQANIMDQGVGLYCNGSEIASVYGYSDTANCAAFCNSVSAQCCVANSAANGCFAHDSAGSLQPGNFATSAGNCN